MRRASFRVALVQQAPVFLNVEATVDLAVRLAAELAAQGVQLVVYPETWIPGYPVWVDAAPDAALWDHPGAKQLYGLLARQALVVGDERFRRLRQGAVDAGVVMVIGAHERVGATLYNTILSFAPDGRYRVHRKLVPTYTERLLWGRGDGSTLEVLDTGLGPIGALVCWEHWMPLARATMHAQHEVLHVAQWPWVRELHQICSRQYAFEGQCFVAASGCCMSRGQMLEGFATVSAGADSAAELLDQIPGDDRTLVLQGGSALIGPDIEYVAEPVYGRDEPVVANVDPDRIDEGHLCLDTAGHYARPDVFRLHVDTRERLTGVVLEPAPGAEDRDDG